METESASVAAWGWGRSEEFLPKGRRELSERVDVSSDRMEMFVLHRCFKARELHAYVVSKVYRNKEGIPLSGKAVFTMAPWPA